MAPNPPLRWAGVGLRPPYHTRLLEERPSLGCLEVITENLLGEGGNPHRVLTALRADAPVLLHGVSLGIGNPDPSPDGLAAWHAYLDRVAALIARYEPAVVSDHLCWGALGGHAAHDLWPLPLTDEALARVVERLDAVQTRLGRAIALENVSSYVSFAASTWTEWDFLAEVTRRSGCGLLLDLNNIIVSAFNHGFDPLTYLQAIPPDAVWQYHLAGHTTHDDPTHGPLKLDTHDHPTPPEVWALFDAALQRIGPRWTITEWDDHFPAWETLYAQALDAEARLSHA